MTVCTCTMHCDHYIREPRGVYSVRNTSSNLSEWTWFARCSEKIWPPKDHLWWGRSCQRCFNRKRIIIPKRKRSMIWRFSGNLSKVEAKGSLPWLNYCSYRGAITKNELRNSIRDLRTRNSFKEFLRNYPDN